MSYFFDLLKSNAVFFSILISGNFANIDKSQLEALDYFFPTDSGLFISTYHLDNEKFTNVTVLLHKELGTVFSFQTSNPKFFDHPELYFGRGAEESFKAPNQINELKINRSKKSLGAFNEFGKQINVTIFKSSSYGYSISLHLK